MIVPNTAPARWTSARVEERLRKAAALRAKLSGRDSELGWLAEGIEIIGGIGVPAPAADAHGNDIVALATAALSWLRWLEVEDAEIVLARLEGAPWKLICFRFGISRPTADRRWRYSLALIAWRLNGRTRSGPTPSLRSLLKLSRAA